MHSKKTVLLVDDEESILFSLQRILELSGDYEIVTAQNGKEALRSTRKIIPDLIISDIVMPEMDGIEFCKKIRTNEITKSVPFIFLTAKKERMLDGFKIGGDDFITKPFTFDEVMVKIEAMFRRIKNTRELASQFKGELKELSLDEILQHCNEKSLSGTIILQSGGQVGKLQLLRGDITEISFNDLPEDQALDKMRGWDSGIFVIRPVGMKLKPEFMKGEDPEETGETINDPIEIAPDTWWVGYRNPRSLLQLNVYLRRFRKEGKAINYLIDPGSPVDFPTVSEKIAKIIGNLSNINIYSLNHPDPDVCMNSTFIRTANAKAICLTTEENWRLISHYDINPRSVKLLDSFKKGRMKLATGHKVSFIPSPYCHAKGAFMVYDLESRVLFTGDLFGGVSAANRINNLYAEEIDWEGIRTFHQIYMPAKRALRMAIDQIKKLDPPPVMIAPQHGPILRGKAMELFIERIYDLDVGTDLMQAGESAEEVEGYVDACNELIDDSVSYIPIDQINHKISGNTQVMSSSEFKDNQIIQIFSRPQKVFQQVALALISGENAQVVNQIKSRAMKIMLTKALPAPELDWDNDQTLTSTPAQIFKEDD